MDGGRQIFTRRKVAGRPWTDDAQLHDKEIQKAFAATVTDYLATSMHSGTPCLPVIRKKHRRLIASTTEAAL